MKSSKYIVYSAMFPNGKLYFGISSKTLKQRVSSHYHAAKYGPKYKMQNALNKYSKSDVKWTVWYEGLEKVEACHYEQALIKNFNSDKQGYNVTSGGECSGHANWDDKRKQEHRIKVSSNNKQFNVFTVKGEFIGKWTSQIQAAEDLKVQQSLINRCLAGKTKSHKGYIFTYDIKPNLSKIQFNRNRKFEVIDSLGNIIGVWSNSNTCAKDLNLPTPREIRAVLTNPKTRKTYKGYSFKYKD